MKIRVFLVQIFPETCARKEMTEKITMHDRMGIGVIASFLGQIVGCPAYRFRRVNEYGPPVLQTNACVCTTKIGRYEKRYGAISGRVDDFSGRLADLVKTCKDDPTMFSLISQFDSYYSNFGKYPKKML